MDSDERFIVGDDLERHWAHWFGECRNYRDGEFHDAIANGNADDCRQEFRRH